ncbi:YdeI/OmpD-associated family protein [Paragemmobacter straminiformis]|uniref:YdeI/OmpD-associated family protein n=1 Tax=Paragemmobacter straminiformis TaxID=2045119 RepID=A0A842I3R0_9RHOB|nr:YdeI/OmpD-associated family protein [Gemmobacter straminiformis]MBC2834165.1 YdeI/OmpD-associated family protein [Gemmobacter straminiformis]
MGGRALTRAPVPLTFATPEEWNFWLSQRHDKAADVWLRLAKKATGTASIDWEQAIEEAIVWGWIDAQKKPDGLHHILHRFTPRRAGSPWTAKARATAEKLIAGGWMEDPGLAEVARARADGRWEAAYAGDKTAEIPDDFLTALDAAPEAAATAFNALSAKARAALAFRLSTAKTPSARSRRIAEYIETLTKSGD